MNGVQLPVEHVVGTTTLNEHILPTVGDIRLHFTTAEGKKASKSQGIISKVDGKVVGKLMLFGLEDDHEIPFKLTKRVYGEFEVNADEFVTAGWDGVLETNKGYLEAQE